MNYYLIDSAMQLAMSF